MKISAYVAMAAKQKLVPFQIDPKKLGPWGVEIEVDYCGICRSDVHLIDNDWRSSIYPLVPGHEIIGTVRGAGKHVERLKVGDRVSVGWQAGSCMECEACLNGDENLCPRSQATCVGNYGGFAERVFVDSRFAFPIPRELDSESTAPLLCGGVTVFSPLRRYCSHPAMKVGIIGLGGLGHLAVQFAHALGCEVTVFSTSPDKEKEALAFGARHFVFTKDGKQMKKAANSLNFILSTVNIDQDWSGMMKLLRSKGMLCIVGVPPNEIRIPPFLLISGEKSICGSVIGNRATIEEMLNLAARHGIKAKTESMSYSEVNQAVDRVRAGHARYRVVLHR